MQPSTSARFSCRQYDEQLNSVAYRLLSVVSGFDSALVAFSGGLDSSVVAKAAQLALGERALAVTAWSPSSCEHEKEESTQVAREIGIQHLLIESGEFEDVRYLRNDKDRCYYCKQIRFSEMVQIAKEQNFQVVLDGSNVDDQFDYRPGRRAAEELGVRSPLAELGITKEVARELAKGWDLSVWNKPAEPCLSTRVPYEQPLTDLLLRRIEAAESCLKAFGFSPLRVRVQGESTARIEAPVDQIGKLLEPPVREKLIERFQTLEFRTVSVDLQGFRSGSMNENSPPLE